MKRAWILVCTLVLAAAAGFQPVATSASVCTEGDYRWPDTGLCCDTVPVRREKVQQKCIGGTWVNTGLKACGTACPYA
jgi:hypothetical protein